jgi:hypothetical protein
MTRTSAKSFVRPECSVKNKGGKVALIMEILWTNNLNMVEVILMMNLKFTVNTITVPGGGRWHYFCTDLQTSLQ